MGKLILPEIDPLKKVSCFRCVANRVNVGRGSIQKLYSKAVIPSENNGDECCHSIRQRLFCFFLLEYQNFQTGNSCQNVLSG